MKKLNFLKRFSSIRLCSPIPTTKMDSLKICETEEHVEVQTNIYDLPDEILCIIFQKLRFDEQYTLVNEDSCGPLKHFRHIRTSKQMMRFITCFQNLRCLKLRIGKTFKCPEQFWANIAKFCPHLEELRFCNKTTSDYVLELIAKYLVNLKYVYFDTLYAEPVGSFKLFLFSLPNLQHLDLKHWPKTVEWHRWLPQTVNTLTMNLDWIRTMPNLSDLSRALHHRLKRLVIYDSTRRLENIISSLCSNFSNLEELDLEVFGLQSLIPLGNLRNLRKFNLRYYTIRPIRMDNELLAVFHNWGEMREFSLKGLIVGDESLRHISCHMPKLEHLSISKIPITDSTVRTFIKLPLKTFGIGSCFHVSENALFDMVLENQNLEELEMCFCKHRRYFTSFMYRVRDVFRQRIGKRLLIRDIDAYKEESPFIMSSETTDSDLELFLSQLTFDAWTCQCYSLGYIDAVMRNY